MVVAGACALIGKVSIRRTSARRSALPPPASGVSRARARGRRDPGLPGPATEDLPILGMLRHGRRRGRDRHDARARRYPLVSRRWAMLEALSAAPDHRSEPRAVPRIHTTRRLSPSFGDLVAARWKLTPALRLHRAVHADDAALDERARLAARVRDARELEELTQADRVAADLDVTGHGRANGGRARRHASCHTFRPIA